jgi:hypothetical protein
MELNLNDRVIILNTVLPQFDTRKNMELKIAIGEKIELTVAEQKDIVCTNVGNGQYAISFKTADAITQTGVYEFTKDELEYLRKRVEAIDSNGMFSLETMATYNKILDAELPD